jgi:hypothetical protein
MDETYFLHSEKGRRNIAERKPRKRGSKAKHRGISNDQLCVLVARDRQKITFSGVLGIGALPFQIRWKTACQGYLPYPECE